jgi:hypothetical protein
VVEGPLDEPEVGQVVLDVQERVGTIWGRSAQTPPGLPLPIRDSRSLGTRELDEERAPLARYARHPQAPPHRLRQALGQGQSEARALHPSPLRSQSFEGDEQSVHHLRRDPRALVADLDAQPLSLDLQAPNDHPSSRSVVLDRVGQQVQQNLLQPLTVGPDVTIG